MIQANVDVNAIDDEGLSALHWVVKSGHVELAKVLLDEGRVNVNIQNSDGQTPLFLATVLLLAQSTPVSTKERIDRVFDMLVEAGADENITDKTGISPFELATSVGRPDLMKRMDRHILEGVDSTL
jgi:ankyrin repeat protein